MPGRVNKNSVVVRGGSQIAPGVVVTRPQRANQPTAGNSGKTIGCGFRNNSAALDVDTFVDIYVPYAFTITACTMVADRSGNCQIDIRADAYAAFPPTGADSICAASKPTISGADKSQDNNLTGWLTSFSAGTTLRFYLLACDTIRAVTLTLTIDPT